MNHHWFVCEQETSWLRLSRRFVPHLVPSASDSVSIESLAASRMVPRLLYGRPAIALWSLETASDCAANLPQLGVLFRSPSTVRTLHFVAVDPRLASDARLDLLAWGVVLLDRPEQLPRYGALITRFWART